MSAVNPANSSRPGRRAARGMHHPPPAAQTVPQVEAPIALPLLEEMLLPMPPPLVPSEIPWLAGLGMIDFSVLGPAAPAAISGWEDGRIPELRMREPAA